MEPKTRVCKACKEEKSLEEFVKVKHCRFGRTNKCKPCTNREKYTLKGPCKNNPGWYKKGHKFHAGGEKGWFKKGERNGQKTEFKKGQKPHNFINGKADELYKKLKHRKMRIVREEVRKRDEYKCTRCKMKNDLLHVHHIIPLRVDMSKAYDLDNLTTLCPKCHVMVEKEYKERNDK